MSEPPGRLARRGSALGRIAGVVARPARDARRTTLRVAIVATGLVFLAYLVIAGAVMMIVTRNLTAAVDDRLRGYLGQVSDQSPRANGFPSQGPAYQQPLLLWAVLPDGEVLPGRARDQQQSSATEPLPDAARAVGSPTTLQLSDGSDLRFDGVQMDVVLGNGILVRNAHVVVADSLANVATAQRNILTAELIVGPALLLAVFFGAYAVGRRVAAPIERARQRQIELTADASHELRTPLSVIEAQTSLALERERDIAWYRNAFAAVGVESKRMRRLVDDLLWLARFDSASPAPTSEATDLGVLAEQAAGRFTAVAQARGLVLRVAVEPVSTMISAPPEWLDRLLGVLLDNACRYTPSGGSVDVQVGRRDSRVRLAVDDSGPGIAVEERSQIFDRFRRASDSPGGSGLGLAIAAAVVGASGGRWEVGESPAGGASMAVSWAPLIRGGAEREGSPRGEASAEATSGAGGALAPPPPPHPA
ncbi:MAG: sensor histidine kinase [Candidatus Dormibacteria bacterium]